jgi:hypothetical protein
VIGYDTATSSFWTPDDPDFIVCYGDKLYENVLAAHARFPKLVKEGRVIDLTAVSALWKDPYSGSDIEPGNAGPKTAVPYVQGEHQRGVERPDIYADLNDMHEVISLLGQNGIHTDAPGPSRPWKMHTAHPNGKQHLCGPHTCGFPYEADITQFWWSSIQGPWHGFTGDLDVNVARDDAFGPVHIDPYLIFPTNLPHSLPNKGNERLTVEEADGALEHPNNRGLHRYLTNVVYWNLKKYRDRLWRVSHYEPTLFNKKRPHPNWSNNRGPRWQLIDLRMRKIAKLR